MAKKAPFRFGRARCIFCERQPPDVKITKEHIFGDWLRGQFPRDATTTHTYGVINYPEPSKGFHNPTIRRKKQQGHSGSSKARVVCQLCNSGWLSNEIEERAKPILTAVMNSGWFL